MGGSSRTASDGNLRCAAGRCSRAKAGHSLSVARTAGRLRQAAPVLGCGLGNGRCGKAAAAPPAWHCHTAPDGTVSGAGQSGQQPHGELQRRRAALWHPAADLAALHRFCAALPVAGGTAGEPAAPAAGAAQCGASGGGSSGISGQELLQCLGTGAALAGVRPDRHGGQCDPCRQHHLPR